MLTRFRSLLIVLACFMFVFALAGCGRKGVGPPPGNGAKNGSDLPGDNGGKNGGDSIDFGALYDRSFDDGHFVKLELWQKVDGKETSGWITIAVSESDGEYSFEYAGEMGDYEFSDTYTFEVEWATAASYIFADYFASAHWMYGEVWRETTFNWLEEYFGELEFIGDRFSFLGLEAEAKGYDRYAGVQGITFIAKKGGQLVYELCVAPGVPVNLYTYHNLDGKEYRSKLVEYRK